MNYENETSIKSMHVKNTTETINEQTTQFTGLSLEGEWRKLLITQTLNMISAASI